MERILIEYNSQLYERMPTGAWYAPNGMRVASLDSILDGLLRAKKDAQLWVGAIRGEIVVFDQRIGPSGVDVVFWDFAKDRFITIDRAQARQLAKTIKSDVDRAPVILRFRYSAVVRHRLKVESSGRVYTGVRQSATNRQRVTHCYSCKSTIDNAIDVECNSCGWILCSCGACGCGYSG